jgi:SAM-dependent methyltransferase
MIRALVVERVYQTSEGCLPFAANSLDLIVVVDMFEHLEQDEVLTAEIDRTLKPGGSVIINVPNPKPGLIRSFRYLLGQTDEKHGHVRPGYSEAQLKELFANFNFGDWEFSHYGGPFSELADAVVTAGVQILKPGAQNSEGDGGSKGVVVSAQDIKSLKKSFKLYSLIAPFLSLMVECDRFVPKTFRTMLIAKANKVMPGVER